MKKYFSILALALMLSLGFASCSVETDEPAGGTAVEKMAGHWIVNTDLIDGTDTIPNVYAAYGIVDWDMTTYNSIVRHDYSVTDDTIMGYMRINHKHTIITDNSCKMFFRSS